MGRSYEKCILTFLRCFGAEVSVGLTELASRSLKGEIEVCAELFHPHVRRDFHAADIC
jgi:hypothetical protein